MVGVPLIRLQPPTASSAAAKEENRAGTSVIQVPADPAQALVILGTRPLRKRVRVPLAEVVISTGRLSNGCIKNGLHILPIAYEQVRTMDGVGAGPGNSSNHHRVATQVTYNYAPSLVRRVLLAARLRKPSGLVLEDDAPDQCGCTGIHSVVGGFKQPALSE
jgi:hypothetical protein